ncbi:hypothetical protein INT48_009732 [Thamnidium elegans]|uniref:RRM domain-containing protein n=1 Tax=Thamnidium elegans TaxID=101142 RepID=A0A8H7T0U5_9FUNG|nr:hypothetical protein INT48_009732 [Thamnidium elegans]
MAEKKLSKREQKAEAFKKRAKKPQFTDEMAVPQSDEIVPEPVKEEEPVKVEKRKAEAISVPTEEGSEPQKKKNRRSKKSSNMDGSRYIVFVEELEKHFEHVEGIKSTRLLTDKATGKPKGFAFMEFEHSKDLNKALAFHHTFFKKRQINVELTAGGGGNKSETRKEKLKVKNERLTEERTKKHEELKGKTTPASSYKIDIPQ